jgi:hypothetical protein
MAIRTFRKRPILIEVVRWTGDNLAELVEWAGARNLSYRTDANGQPHLRVKVHAEEDWCNCPVGHYVARGVYGEFYPIREDILHATYDEVDA